MDITDTEETEVLPYIRLETLNSISVKNKDYIIIEELEDKNVEEKIWMKNQHG